MFPVICTEGIQFFIFKSTKSIFKVHNTKINNTSFYNYSLPTQTLTLQGKLGGFAFSTAGFLSFTIATLMSVLDSIGDYSACARTARVTPLPRFAFNRGIAVEGLTTILGGSLGCCHASVSYGSNIGAMGITGVNTVLIFKITSTSTR